MQYKSKLRQTSHKREPNAMMHSGLHKKLG